MFYWFLKLNIRGSKSQAAAHWHQISLRHHIILDLLVCLEVFKWITLATYCNVVRFLSSLSVRAEFMRCVLSIVAEPAQPFSQSVSLSL